jgi:PAS domain S-box-containing protein
VRPPSLDLFEKIRLTPSRICGAASLCCLALGPLLVAGLGSAGSAPAAALAVWFKGLALMMAGVGLLADLVWPAGVTACGLAAIATAVTLLYQLAAGIDLGIPEALLGTYPHWDGRSAGAVVYSGALCILLLGVVLVLLARRRPQSRLVIAALAIAAAAAQLTELIVDLSSSASGTRGLLPSAASAAGVAIAGCGCALLLWTEAKPAAKDASRWISVLTSVAGLAMTLFLWQAVAGHLDERAGHDGLPWAILLSGVVATGLAAFSGARLQYYRFNLNVLTEEKNKIRQTITAAAEAEKRLLAAHLRLQDSIDSMPAGIAIFSTVRNEAGNISDFVLDYVNEAGSALVGVPRDRALGKPLSTLFANSWPPPFFVDSCTVVETGTPVIREVRTGDGGPLEENAIALEMELSKLGDGFVATCLDTTERDRAQEAHREIEARYQAFFQGVPVGLYRTSPTGEILEANPALVQVLRFPDLETLRALNTSAFYLDPATRAKQQELLDSVGVIRGYEMRVMCFDSSMIWLRDTCRAVRNQQGEIIYYEGMLEDITERRAADEQIRKSLAEKETLLKEVHHRVKNNLQVICSLLNLQAGQIRDTRDLEMFMESQDRVRSMAMVHERLYQSPDLAEIDFGEYARNLATHLVRAYGRSTTPVALSVEARGMSLGVDDAVACGLIINELVSNSLKHAFREGQGGKIWVTLFPSAGENLLTAGDDGVGLPPSVSLDNADTLGLQLVSTLTEQLDGRIEVRRGPGTEFKIRFPRKETQS